VDDTRGESAWRSLMYGLAAVMEYYYRPASRGSSWLGLLDAACGSTRRWSMTTLVSPRITVRRRFAIGELCVRKSLREIFLAKLRAKDVPVYLGAFTARGNRESRAKHVKLPCGIKEEPRVRGLYALLTRIMCVLEREKCLRARFVTSQRYSCLGLPTI